MGSGEGVGGQEGGVVLEEEGGLVLDEGAGLTEFKELGLKRCDMRGEGGDRKGCEWVGGWSGSEGGIRRRDGGRRLAFGFAHPSNR